MTALSLLSLIAGVVLPAVWSRKFHRRKAAHDVLRLILDAWVARKGKEDPHGTPGEPAPASGGEPGKEPPGASLKVG
ncbi:hypothetical protein [Streptosporangium saharense]|uniref:hypothetical protein n=1 Tax=Streptosporangium saharense TaxID=1706840 RepID=UPI003325642C